jgi:hypothetical protein
MEVADTAGIGKYADNRRSDIVVFQLKGEVLSSLCF